MFLNSSVHYRDVTVNTENTQQPIWIHYKTTGMSRWGSFNPVRIARLVHKPKTFSDFRPLTSQILSLWARGKFNGGHVWEFVSVVLHKTGSKTEFCPPVSRSK